MENAHADGHHEGRPHPDCPACKEARRTRLGNQAISKVEIISSEYKQPQLDREFWGKQPIGLIMLVLKLYADTR